MHAAGLAPYHLECEARTDPIGIDVPQPRLSWKLKSDQNGDAQVAYRILVASAKDKLEPARADLWDSGRVSSTETAWIRYRGAAPHSFQRVWWKVETSSALGGSSWSEPAEWTTGVLRPEDRKGSWIAPASYVLRAGPMPIFRHEFTIDKALRRALLFAAGLGFHEARINGQKVGANVLEPAWTNFRSTVLYESYDVSALLAKGRNAVGVLLGNGFYNVVGGRYSKYTGSFGVPRLWLQLHLEYEDGSVEDIGTDRTWRVHDGPITFSDTYGGEDFDARLEPSGWDLPGFDDSHWPHGGYVEAPGGELKSDASPPVRVRQTFEPVRVTQPKPGISVYDLGQNFAGWPKIAVSGAAGASVRLTCGELLDKDGLVTQRSSGGPNYFTYTLKGNGQETWSPRFSYYGFRYVQVEISGVAEIRKLEGEFIYVSAENTGHFSSSNDLLNRIHALIDAAIKSNLQHVVTDCPHREKLGWLEETYLMGPSLLYSWDLRNVLPKIIRDIQEAQIVDGLIPDIAPEYVQFSSGFRDSPEWGSAGIMLPWLAWQWYGDKAPLASAYETMQRFNGYLQRKSTNGLLLFGLGDWYDIAPGPPGPSKLTPPGVTSTATWIRDLEILGEAARLLGRDADAKAFDAQLHSERDVSQRNFFKASENSYATGSQTALAMPLVIGIAPSSARNTLVGNLVADIRRRGNHTSAGDIGFHYVIEALMNAGRDEVIYDMAVERSPPSYSAQLAAGATSLTEAWDADPHSSQNHLMLGHIEQWFFAGLAGIRPDSNSPGLEHIIIEPRPVGDLRWVNASVESVRGTITVQWRIANGAFHLDLGLPPGTTADVRLPARSMRIEDAATHTVRSGHSAFDVEW